MTELEKTISEQGYGRLDTELRYKIERARLAYAKYNAHPSSGEYQSISSACLKPWIVLLADDDFITPCLFGCVEVVVCDF